MDDGLLEDTHGIAVTELVGVLGQIPLPAEVADADRDDSHVAASGIHVPQALAEDLADVVEAAWAG